MGKPVRRNFAHLTLAEQQQYVAAVVAADQRFFSGGVISYWDMQDWVHQATHVHGGPAFLPWHRELCNRYEELLQEVDPEVALHYWDWTTDPRSSPDGSGGTTDMSVPTLLGTMNGTITGALAPLHNGGVLAGSRDQTGQPQDPPRSLTRALPPGPPAGVPGDASFLAAGAGLPQAQQYDAFQANLQNFHGGVHVAFGAATNIGDPSGHKAFQDPFVFLLHSNVDRLFAMWQCEPGQEWRRDPALVYGNESTSVDITENLAPWDGSDGLHPWNPVGGLIEVRNSLDPQVVTPPCYDTLPTQVIQVAPEGTGPIRFLDVPAGSTTARSMRIEVCGPTRVQLTGVLTGDPVFTLHEASELSPEPDGYSTETVFMWVLYTGGAPGSTANGHLAVTCTETGTVLEADIVANSITKPAVAVSMVLDSSGSMSSPSGVPGLDRMAVLHQTAPTFIALLDDTDGVGVVRFDTDATQVSPVAQAQPLGTGGGRDTAAAAVNAHTTNLSGLTAIGDGIEAAHDQLAASPPGFTHKAILVFTDGEETEPQFISQVTSLIDERVFAVGLGTANQLNPTGLSAITNGTGGYLTLTGALDTDGVMRLAKYFSQLLAGVTNAQIVTDPTGSVLPGERELVPFALTRADRRCDVVLLTEAPDAFEIILHAPDGTRLTAGPDADLLGAPAMRCLRMPLPVVSSPATHGGAWKAELRVDTKGFSRYLGELERRRDVAAIQRVRAHGIPYTLTVHSVSDLKAVVSARQDGYVPGSTAHLSVVLTETGIPLSRQSSAAVEVTRPDGTTSTVKLHEDEPGVLRGTTLLTLAGDYPLLFNVSGHSFGGEAFTRQELRNAAVWTAPHLPPTGEPALPHDRDWCDLLFCVLDDGCAGRALAERGVGVDRLRECIKRFCSSKR